MISQTDTLDIVLTTGQVYHIGKDPSKTIRHVLNGMRFITINLSDNESVYLNTDNISEMRHHKKGVA